MSKIGTEDLICPDCGNRDAACICGYFFGESQEVPDFAHRPLPTACVTDAPPLGPSSLRKCYPVASGVLDYFPDAIMEVALVSWTGNEQHHPGEPLHWDRSKSTDEADAQMRHFLQRGTRDTDGMRHSAKNAWRALALLQKEIEAERQKEANHVD